MQTTMSRGTLNLLLAAALLALGAVAWYKPGAATKPEGEPAFPGVAGATLIRATNTAPGMSWTLERSAGGEWALTAPFHLPTEPAVMAALFRDRPDAVRATRAIAERCAFTLANLGYTFPDYDVPPGETIAYEYISSYWVQPTGEAEATLDAPADQEDTLLFPRLLLVRGLKLSFLRARGTWRRWARSCSTCRATSASTRAAW